MTHRVVGRIPHAHGHRGESRDPVERINDRRGKRGIVHSAAIGQATDFFRHGATGFSPSATDGCLDGVQLHATDWQDSPMTISDLTSSLFDDAATFPAGTCTLDSAMIMTNISARWTADPGGTLAMNPAA